MTRPRKAAIRSAHAQGQAACARGPGYYGTVLQYEWAYRDRHAAWPLGCVAIQTRHGLGKSYDTMQEARGDTAGPGLRHDQARPVTRRSVRTPCLQPGFKVCTWCT